MSSSVDAPVLKDVASARVAMNRTRISVTSSHLSAMHVRLYVRRFDRLLDDLITVARVHRFVAIAVKNDGRYIWLAARNRETIEATALSHGEKRRGKVSGGATG